MPLPRPDDACVEFIFTPEEARAAKVLTPLAIQWLQTKYAQKFKQKASVLVPEDMSLDRSHIQKICEMDGYLNCIQELMDDHKMALSDMAAGRLNQGAESDLQNQAAIAVIASSASSKVHGA